MGLFITFVGTNILAFAPPHAKREQIFLVMPKTNNKNPPTLPTTTTHQEERGREEIFQVLWELLANGPNSAKASCVVDGDHEIHFDFVY